MDSDAGRKLADPVSHGCVDAARSLSALLSLATARAKHVRRLVVLGSVLWHPAVEVAGQVERAWTYHGAAAVRRLGCVPCSLHDPVRALGDLLGDVRAALDDDMGGEGNGEKANWNLI